MRLTVSSDIDEFVFSNGIPQDRQDKWIVGGGLTGWYGTPPPRDSKAENKPGEDGTWWPSNLNQSGRTVTIKGATECVSSMENMRITRRICDLMSRKLTLTMEDENGIRITTGYLAADPEPAIWWDRKRVNFTFIIYCPDPHKYGLPLTYQASNGIVSVENPGALPVWPRIRVDGHVQSLTLSLNGRSVRWSGDAWGLDLDFADMIPSAGTVGADDAFTVPPGLSTLQVAVTTGATVSVSFAPAWR
ncbi:hypothetical protein [Bifidobacterium sp. ESL0745]|uniref:hypothetical protein n=1 Tax=Bifidobacterium sp. ESL0745 TaxID=2983226 RepID=UPI0023F9EC94|nr:hypothetical protein [Bifidobacterium sp. ESL0745]MDF7665736.1 hypothetical protein [Bifidobacterium sp. ESL0745]